MSVFNGERVNPDSVGKKLMKSMLGFRIAIFASFIAASLTFAPPANAQFDGIEWTSDKSNLPTQDKSGPGRTPPTKNVKVDKGPHRFRISSSKISDSKGKDDKQRQEWKFERRSGFVKMETAFRISEKEKDFDRIALVQNHDDQTGSAGVFSIYHIRKSGNSYYFGVQGDTTEAENSYRNFSTVKIKLGKYYGLRLQSHINGRNESVEVAQLYESGKEIWREEIRGGGDSQGYYKIGLYKLSRGSGKITAEFKNTRFWTGEKPKKASK